MYLCFLLSVTWLEVLQIELVELLLHFRWCWLLYRCHVQSSVLLDLVNHEDSWLDYLAFFSALDLWSLIVCCFSYQAVCQACVFCFLASQLIHTFDLLFSYILVIIRGNLSLLWRDHMSRNLLISKDIVKAWVPLEAMVPLNDSSCLVLHLFDHWYRQLFLVVTVAMLQEVLRVFVFLALNSFEYLLRRSLYAFDVVRQKLLWWISTAYLLVHHCLGDDLLTHEEDWTFVHLQAFWKDLVGAWFRE